VSLRCGALRCGSMEAARDRDASGLALYTEFAVRDRYEQTEETDVKLVRRSTALECAGLR
jgi:hypothetical protein